MVACELGYDDPGIEGTILNDAVYFVHFVFSFCLFEWLKGVWGRMVRHLPGFWGLGVSDKFPQLKIPSFPPARESGTWNLRKLFYPVSFRAEGSGFPRLRE